MLDTLVRFSDWLNSTPFSAMAASIGWVVPTVQTIHILAIAVVIVAAVLINLRALGMIEQQVPLATLTRRFVPPMLIAMLVLALTGVVMIASEPYRALFRTAFWIKMVMIVAGVLLTFAVARVAQAQGEATAQGVPTPRNLRLLAALGLLLWLAIIWAGRWIAYAPHWEGSPH